MDRLTSNEIHRLLQMTVSTIVDNIQTNKQKSVIARKKQNT